MHWLDRLLGRSELAEPRRIAELDQTCGTIELSGRIECAEPIEDPIARAPAVVIRYRARIPGVGNRYFGLPDASELANVVAGTPFVLRDASGWVRVEIGFEHVSGGQLDALHRRLSAEHGVDLEAEVEWLGPGDSVRIRATVRELPGAGSPHRSDPATVVVVEEIERLDLEG